MKKPKHTPGPWFQSHRVCNEEGDYSTQVYDQEGKTICTVDWYPVYEDWGISTSREANAKLIAAAPEMYDIISRAVELFEQDLSADEYITEMLKMEGPAKELIYKILRS